MNLSKTKILFFFLAIALIGWILYPKDLFLGFINEGLSDLQKAESSYKLYLNKKPYSKFATLKLAELYERMASPEKSIVHLKKLLQHRKNDWGLVEFYLNYLERMQDDQALYEARLEIASRMLEARSRVPIEKIESLLTNAYQYALWKQKTEEAYQILHLLIKTVADPQIYKDDLFSLDLSLKKTHRVIHTLESSLQENLLNFYVREELINIYRVIGKPSKALDLVHQGLQLDAKYKPLLWARSYLHEELGFKKELENDLKELIRVYSVGDPEWKSALYRLVAWYIDEKRYGEAISWLEHEGQKSDPKIKKKLLELYLYFQKRTDILDDYWNYLLNDPRLDFGLDVFFMLEEKGKRQESLNWLEKLRGQFGDQKRILSLLLDLYLDSNNHQSALALLEVLAKKYPEESRWDFIRASLYSLTGQPQKAKGIYVALAKKFSKNVSDLKTVGRELLFLGYAGQSRDILQHAVLLAPKDDEARFWLSEVYYFLEDHHAAKKVILQSGVLPSSLKKESKKDSLKTLQMKLKVAGRLQWDQGRQYIEALQKYPQDSDLRIDLIDFLLAHNQWRDALKHIEILSQLPQVDFLLLSGYQARIAAQKGQWNQAIRTWKDVLKKNPHSYFAKRELAFAYSRQGKKHLALQEMEALASLFGPFVKEQEFYRELRRDLDKTVGTSFEYARIGSDYFHREGLSYKQPLSQSMDLGVNAVWGEYFSGLTNQKKSATTARLVGTFRGRHGFINAGVHVGITEATKAYAPFLEVQYEIADKLHLGSRFSWQDLRTDISQAVLLGDKMTKASFMWNYSPWDWLTLSGKYEFQHEKLPHGMNGSAHLIEPALSLRVLTKPFILAGYQSTILRRDESDELINELRLIPKQNAHYATGFLSHAWTNRFRTDMSFFIGEDFDRDLHLFEGDLWGGRAGLFFEPLSWMNIQSYYEYGRETIVLSTGQSHRMGIELTGHWK